MTSKREYRERYLGQKSIAQWWYERWRAQCEKNSELADENERLRRRLDAASVQS